MAQNPKKNAPSHLGKNLNYYREKSGLTRQLIAQVAEVSNSIITKIEKGEQLTLAPEPLSRITHYLGITPECLTGEEPNQNHILGEMLDPLADLSEPDRFPLASSGLFAVLVKNWPGMQSLAIVLLKPPDSVVRYSHDLIHGTRRLELVAEEAPDLAEPSVELQTLTEAEARDESTLHISVPLTMALKGRIEIAIAKDHLLHLPLLKTILTRTAHLFERSIHYTNLNDVSAERRLARELQQKNDTLNILYRLNQSAASGIGIKATAQNVIASLFADHFKFPHLMLATAESERCQIRFVASRTFEESHFHVTPKDRIFQDPAFKPDTYNLSTLNAAATSPLPMVLSFDEMSEDSTFRFYQGGYDEEDHMIIAALEGSHGTCGFLMSRCKADEIDGVIAQLASMEQVLYEIGRLLENAIAVETHLQRNKELERKNSLYQVAFDGLPLLQKREDTLEEKLRNLTVHLMFHNVFRSAAISIVNPQPVLIDGKERNIIRLAYSFNNQTASPDHIIFDAPEEPCHRWISTENGLEIALDNEADWTAKTCREGERFCFTRYQKGKPDQLGLFEPLYVRHEVVGVFSTGCMGGFQIVTEEKLDLLAPLFSALARAILSGRDPYFARKPFRLEKYRAQEKVLKTTIPDELIGKV